MKQYLLLLPILALFLLTNVHAQGTVQVIVKAAEATSTCDDRFSNNNHPSMRVKINGGDWALYRYPQNPSCEESLPHTQFSEMYDCPVEVGRTSFEVCLEVFENDALNFFNCNINPDGGCTVEICQDFQLPFPGTEVDYSLAIPDGEASGGNIDFTINIDDRFVGGLNDLACTATDFGTLERGMAIGDGNTEAFTNYCGTNENEIHRIQLGDDFLGNGFGVWHKFTTGPEPSSKVVIEAKSSTVDPIHLQLALFEAVPICLDTPIVRAIAATRETYDERMDLECDLLKPNTDYLILVDGYNDIEEEFFGYYSLEIKDASSREAANTACDAEDLGVIPDGGQVAPTETYSNFCADAIGDPRSTAFVVEQGVLFSFVAPSSGNVMIQGVSDPNGLDALSLEMAVFAAADCNGVMNEVAALAAGSPAPSLAARCLEGGQRYYLLVDGDRDNVDGLFNLRISDIGEEPNVTTIDTTLCAGQRIAIGIGIYNTTGEYEEIIPLASGCDSTVILNLMVQTPLELDGDLVENATDETATDGVASVEAMGGSGVYTYEWSDGQTTATATDLVANTEYCVTVMDETGCDQSTCVFIDFINSIQPDVSADPLNCNGDNSGQIAISATKGEPPYAYNWQGIDNDLSGNGTITAEDELFIIENLPAGEYEITFADMDDTNRDTTLSVEITQPTPLTLEMSDNVSATCFAECNGALTVNSGGGNGNYRYEWSNGAQAEAITELCAGEYSVTVFDNNECETTLALTVNEPSEFIATATEIQAVSCFSESDGQIEVTANKNIQTIQWSTGDATATVANLAAGTYEVTITDLNDCSAVSSVVVTEPDAPLAVSIQIGAAITCNGVADGSLRVNATGPAEQLTYQWSNGSTTSVADLLPAGDYSVTITNANGCTAMASTTLTEPTELTASVSANIITCLDEPNAGEIYIENTAGGITPYEYSLDGVIYTANPNLNNLFDGNYEVLIRDAVGCEISRDVMIEGPPEVVVDLGNDFTAKLGEPVILDAISNIQNPIVSWQADTLDCQSANCESVELFPLETQTYSVTVVDSITQCRATDQITVTIDKARDVFIPNAFSPDGDGYNDRFTVFTGNDVERVLAFRVYNRYGALVYEMEDFKPNDVETGWDGSFNGESLNSGVYVWMAEVVFIDGWQEMYRGDVTIF
ncbi:MAG: gliding motility-associated C-terminal domain-containing protein [Saprospiraceae bacterium]